MHALFEDRADAGRLLADQVAALGLADPVVMTLPRGGAIVGLPVALALHAPMDLLLAAKIGARGQPELAVAAIAETDDPAQPSLVVDDEQVPTQEAFDDLQARVPGALAELARRRRAYLHGRARVSVEGRTVVLVDDGIATGSTVRAALQSLRRFGPAAIVIAVPVAPAAQCAELARIVDRVVCLTSPAWFGAVSTFYRHFEPVDDADVVRALDEAAALAQH